LESFEQAGEGIGFGGWQIGEETGEPLAQCSLSRTEGPLPVFGQGQRLPAAIVATDWS